MLGHKRVEGKEEVDILARTDVTAPQQVQKCYVNCLKKGKLKRGQEVQNQCRYFLKQ